MTEVKTRAADRARIRQGAIYRNVDLIERVDELAGVIQVSRIRFPHVVVLTQDCDLQQDYSFRYGKITRSTQDKLLLSVLVAPLYNAEHVYSGTHLSELDTKMRPIDPDKSKGKSLCQNQLPRYHYLTFPSGSDIPPSVVDFKHYFSVCVDYLKQEKKDDFICWIAPIYREQLCQRFGAFLSRIGVPPNG